MLKNRVIDFSENLEKEFSVKASDRQGVPYAMVPSAYEGDVRTNEYGGFMKYTAVFSEKEYKAILNAAKAALPVGLRGAAEAVAEKTREILSTAGLDSEGMVPYIMLEKIAGDLLKVAAKDKNGKYGKDAFPVRLDEAEKLAGIEWSSVKEEEVLRLTGFVEANKAEEFFAGYDKESGHSMDALETRRVQDRNEEPEIEKELVLNVPEGPIEGNKAKTVEEDAAAAGINTGDYKSEKFVVKKDAEGIQKDGSKKNASEKGDNKPKESSKKGHMAKRDNVRTKAREARGLTGHEGGRDGR